MNDDDEEPFQPVAYQSKVDQNNDMIFVNIIEPLKKESSSLFEGQNAMLTSEN